MYEEKDFEKKGNIFEEIEEIDSLNCEEKVVAINSISICTQFLTIICC